MIRHWLSGFLLAAAVPAIAQDEYGGGWATPSLDVSLSIGQDVVNKSIMDRIIRNRGGGSEAGPRAPVAPSPGRRSLFAGALAPGRTPAEIRTDFVRSRALQKQSETALLAQIKARGVPDYAQYERFFAERDIAAEFEKGAREYGLKANDAADTLAGYWLTAWIVANGADDFSASAARGVRAQVKAGMARTAVGGYDPAKLHRVADEAIFNTLTLTQIYYLAKQGKVSAAEYRRIGEVTRQGFRNFGTDLRALKLTDAGFAAK